MSIDQITVTKPVDGTVKRRTRGKGRPKPAVHHVVLDRRVLASAQRLITGGTYTRYEIVSPTEAVVR